MDAVGQGGQPAGDGVEWDGGAVGGLGTKQLHYHAVRIAGSKGVGFVDHGHLATGIQFGDLAQRFVLQFIGFVERGGKGEDTGQRGHAEDGHRQP